jgi:pyrroloquinoline quinone biosynthesis protein B
MRVLVLGSGAGGGVPQWNCRCSICSIAWSEPTRVRHRTQTSVAVGTDDGSFVILDASPDLRQQIIATPELYPRQAGRHSPIAAVVLTSGEVDHVAGLLCLREGHAFSVFGTRPTLDNLAASPLFEVLRPDRVARTLLEANRPVVVGGLTITPFCVPGKVPLYREGDSVAVGAVTENVIGLEVSDGRRRLAYVPGVAHLPDDLRDRLGAADLLLLDGTTFTDDELVAANLSPKTATRMGHLPMSGEQGSLHAFPADAPVRKIYIHLNNTNPVLLEDSAERQAVAAAGWTVAHDGLEIVL